MGGVPWMPNSILRLDTMPADGDYAWQLGRLTTVGGEPVGAAQRSTQALWTTRACPTGAAVPPSSLVPDEARRRCEVGGNAFAEDVEHSH